MQAILSLLTAPEWCQLISIYMQSVLKPTNKSQNFICLWMSECLAQMHLILYYLGLIGHQNWPFQFYPDKNVDSYSSWQHSFTDTKIYDNMAKNTKIKLLLESLLKMCNLITTYKQMILPKHSDNCFSFISSKTKQTTI